MRNWWIRFGCFLTGYNYAILHASSEVSAKAVKRYTSALLIVCTLWAFIGFLFTDRYLHGGFGGSIAGAVIMVIIVIQIERQIILAVTPSRLLRLSRMAIAILMAIIGSIIIDQIIFKDDIGIEKITFLQKRINDALPLETEQLRNQIDNLDTAIQKKEAERAAMLAEVTKIPFIKTVSTTTSPNKVKTTTKDSAGKEVSEEHYVNTVSATTTNVPNPKLSQIASLDQTIAELRKQKAEKDNKLLTVRPDLEAKYNSKVGFLDELNIMCSLLSKSVVARCVWFMWFLFLLFLELLVLISKTSEKENDYDLTVLHQMDHHKKKLAVLAQLATKDEKVRT